MLQIRLREGLALSELTASQIGILENYPAEVLITEQRAQLTPTGRLIADRIVRALI